MCNLFRGVVDISEYLKPRKAGGSFMCSWVPSSGGQDELKAPDPHDVENLTIGTNI